MPVGTVFWMLTDRMLQSSSLLRAPASHSTPAPVPGAVPEKLPRSASAASPLFALPYTLLCDCLPLL